jgi:hypothetical protein
MARDILSEYGHDAHKPQAARATKGGCTEARDVHNYKHPVGPKDQHHEGPGNPDASIHPHGTQGHH